MPRYIDADSFLEKYGGWYTEEGTEEGFIGTIKGLVDAQPTLSPDDLRPVGKWLRKEKVRHNLDGDGDYRYECSACGHSDEHNENVHVPFCWYCGAKMEVSEDA